MLSIKYSIVETDLSSSKKAKRFISLSMGLSLLFLFKTLLLFSQQEKKQNKMFELLKKSSQFNGVNFGGKFLVNKPVNYGSAPNVQPYSNLFYLSHSVAVSDCEFPLHPHKGFEIMTFVTEGEISHFDDESKKWTPLKTGDFQVIQTNEGLQHREWITKGTTGFQIWFDPNFEKSTKDRPAYKDYNVTDFEAKTENGISTTIYIGSGSKAVARTPGLIIKKLSFPTLRKTSLPLDENSSYTFYVLNGTGTIDNQEMEKDDAVRLSNMKQLDLNFEGEIFFIQTPTRIDYKSVWVK